MAAFFKIFQVLIAAAWMAIIYNLFSPFSGTLYTILVYAGLIMLIFHLVEWLVIKNRLRRLNQDNFVTFIMVILFGSFWWIPVLRQTNT